MPNPSSRKELLSPKRSVIFTACSANYLCKAAAMALSALDHHSDVDLVILVVDGKRPASIADSRISLLWGEDLGFEDYLKTAFKYNIIEFNTALKPFAALYLLSSYDQVIYLDPDVCVFSPLSSVYAGLEVYDAVFTPHALSPYCGNGRPSDRDLLRFGSFNLGFFAVRRSHSAIEMLTWWHNRCRLECFYEPHLGLGVDQKWIDLAFAFFNGMGLLRDVGLNVAFWNLHERHLSHTAEGWRVNGDVGLGFVHFSSFVESEPSAIADKQSRYANGSRPDFTRAGNVYREYLDRSRLIVDISNTRYTYGEFEDGSAVLPSLRRFYAVCAEPNVLEASNPFATHGPVYKFACQHRLRSLKPSSAIHLNFKVQAHYSSQKKVLKYAFRVVLYLIGPERYFNLMRYLAHYSSLLNQGDLL
jgi:hypothetical protein